MTQVFLSETRFSLRVPTVGGKHVGVTELLFQVGNPNRSVGKQFIRLSDSKA